jgi:hypothetical protein
MRVFRAALVAGLLCARCGDDVVHHPGGDMSASAGDMAVASGRCTVGAPRPLSDLPGSHVTPRIEWNGTGFVAAWITNVTAGARVDVAVTDGLGAHLGPNLPLSTQPTARSSSPPSVAVLTVGTVVAWTRTTSNGDDVVFDTLDANGERLDASGTPCDPAADGCGIFAVTNSGTASFPALGRTGRNPDGTPTDADVTLAYVDERNHCGSSGCNGLSDVFWTRVRADGTVGKERQVTPMGSNVVSTFPRMAYDGSHDALVWRDDTQPPLANFLFAMIDTNGNVVAGPGLVGSAAGQATRQSVPDLVYAAGGFALVDASGDDPTAAVLMQRFAGDGTTLLGATPLTNGTSACTPAIATDGTDFALVWQSPCNQPGGNIVFTRVDASGKRVQVDMPVTDFMASGSGIAATPTIAAADTGYGVAWEQRGMGDGGTMTSEIWFARISCN